MDTNTFNVIGFITLKGFMNILNLSNPLSLITCERLNYSSTHILVFFKDKRVLPYVLIGTPREDKEIIYQIFECEEIINPDIDYQEFAFRLAEWVLEKRQEYFNFYFT